MTIFVAGGTGKTGRRVVTLLQDRDIAVRVGSRAAATPFDWSEPGTWAPALAGSSLAYVAYAPDLAVPQAPGQIDAFTRVALEAGVERFVLLSGRNEPEAEEAEQALLALAPASTVLRASWMNQNFTEGAFAAPLRDGMLALPVGAVAEPFVDAGDVAEAAVAVLTGRGHDGRVYELTGPRLLTFAEAVAEIGGATFLSVPMADFEAELRAAGEPEEAVALLRYLFGTLFDGRNASVGDGIARLLGRPPRDFRAFVEAECDPARSGGTRLVEAERPAGS